MALGSDNIYGGTDCLAGNGVEFIPAPPDVYYEKGGEPVAGHEQPIERLR